jgi:hypothetical protein
MMDRFWRGWAMAKASFAVLRRCPKLAIFPVLSGAFFILILGAIALSVIPDRAPLHAVWDRLGSSDEGQYAFYACRRFWAGPWSPRPSASC